MDPSQLNQVPQNKRNFSKYDYFKQIKKNDNCFRWKLAKIVHTVFITLIPQFLSLKNVKDENAFLKKLLFVFLSTSKMSTARVLNNKMSTFKNPTFSQALTRDRCYDFLNIFTEKFSERIVIFDSKQS
jgi:hypothetical protein